MLVETYISSASVIPGLWQYACENNNESLPSDVGTNEGDINLAIEPDEASWKGNFAEPVLPQYAPLYAKDQ